MTTLYWFALIVGAGMLGLALFGDLFDHGADGLDTDGGADAGADTDHHGLNILSTRNATYFLFAFGATGLLLTWIWAGARAPVVAAIATVLGLAGGAIAAVAFGWVGRTESGWMLDDRAWIGCTGVVLLPLQATGTGKILVDRAGRSHELLARPFEPDALEPEAWSRVLIVEMEGAIALVSPYNDALEGADRPRLTPQTE